MLHELRRFGYEPEWRRVETEADYLSFLDADLDLILADYNLPAFDAPRALELLNERNLDIPFVVVSGGISEEVAVECLKRGAADYLLKDRLARLGPAVAQALEEKKLRDERRMSREALARSHKEWEDTFNAMSDWVCLVDPSRRIMRSNAAGHQFTGVTAAEMTGRVCCQLAHGGEKSIPNCPLQKMLVSRQRETAEIPVPGSDSWLMIAVDPVKDEDGDIVGAVHVVRDITERKMDEAKVQHLNAVLHSIRSVNRLIVGEKRRDRLIQGACDALFSSRGFSGVWIVLTDGLPDRIEGARRGFSDAEFTSLTDVFRKGGLPACCRRDQPQSDVTVTADPTATCQDCALVDLYMGNSAINVELRHGDRRYGYLGISVPPQYMGDEEEASLLLEVTGDIAFALNGIEVEAERDRSEQTLRVILEAASDGILLADAESQRFVIANKTMCRMLGYSVEEIKGLSVADIHRAEDMPAVAATFEKQRRGESTLAEDIPVRRKDGSVFLADVNTGRLELYGRPHLLGVFRDITDRKQAEESLVESEKRFRHAFENANAGMCLVNTEGRLFKVNDAMSRIFGYTKEELERLTVNDIAHPEDVNISPKFMKQAVDGETGGGVFEKRCLHKDGHTVWGQVSSSLVRDEQGNPSYFISQVQDITDQRKAEMAIREGESRFRELFNNMSSGVALYEAVDDGNDYVFKDINRAAERIDSLAREDVIGRRATEIFPGIEEFGLLEVLKRVWRTGKAERLMSSFYKDERISGWRDNYVYRLPSNEIVAVYDDITEHKQAEAALKESEGRHRTLLEAMSDSIVSYDSEGRVIYANPTFEKTFGWSEDEIIGQRVDFVPEESRSETELAIKTVQETGKAVLFDTHRLTKDGQVLDVQVSASVFKNETEKVDGCIVVLRDVTEQNKLQEQFFQAQKMEAVGRLAGGVAHDFNNLLTIISGYSEMALSHISPTDPLFSQIEEIKKAGRRAAALTRQLLAFSRRQVVEVRVMDLNLTLGDVEKMLRRLIGEDIDLVIAPSADMGAVKADPGLLEQVIMNLAVNARDAMPRGGRLMIET
ncbi:MAG: PAS domain S-box protein, partial [Proteobacteria bacterium]|nr:PAS domain S-box protein [Pseudomonadota bacterium]